MNADVPLFKRLTDGADAFSKNQRVLAKYVLANYQTVAFSTVSQIAAQSGVSEATIVRFAKALDFTGYPAFQKEIRRLVRAELKGTDRFRLGDVQKRKRQSPLDAIIQKELENIRALQEAFDASSFQSALQLLRSASEVIVIGERSAAPLANHWWFGLTKIGVRARRVLAVASETYDEIDHLDKDACVATIGFPRYLKEQVALLQLVRHRKLATLAITDSPFSPLKGDVNLYAPAESASFVAFHSAPLILINALLHEMSLADKAQTLEALNRFEALADRSRLFYTA